MRDMISMGSDMLQCNLNYAARHTGNCCLQRRMNTQDFTAGRRLVSHLYEQGQPARAANPEPPTARLQQVVLTQHRAELARPRRQVLWRRREHRQRLPLGRVRGSGPAMHAARCWSICRCHF